MKQKNIGLIGCGHLGFAIAKSFLANGLRKDKLFISFSGRKSTFKKLESEKLKECISTNLSICNECDIIFLITRPYQLSKLNLELKENQIVISCIAGKEIQDIERILEHKVYRIMPTNPRSIIEEEGCSALYPFDYKITEILESLNIEVLKIEDERDFHIFTALSVLPVILLQSEMLNIKIDKNKVIEEFIQMKDIINWSFEHIPKIITQREKDLYISTTATPGGITERMLEEYKLNKDIMETIYIGVKRSLEIQQLK